MHGHDGRRFVRKLGERAGASPGEAVRPDQAAGNERAFVGDMLLGIGMAIKIELRRRLEQPPAFGSRDERRRRTVERGMIRFVPNEDDAPHDLSQESITCTC